MLAEITILYESRIANVADIFKSRYDDHVEDGELSYDPVFDQRLLMDNYGDDEGKLEDIIADKAKK